jgi:hypothetical protein
VISPDTLSAPLAHAQPYLPFIQAAVAFIGSLLTIGSVVIAVRALTVQSSVPRRNSRHAAYFELIASPAVTMASKLSDDAEEMFEARLPAIHQTSLNNGGVQTLRLECASLAEAWKTIVRPLERRLASAAAAWGDQTHRKALRVAVDGWIDSVSLAIDPFVSGKGSAASVLDSVREGMAVLLGVVILYDAQAYMPRDSLAVGRFAKLREDLSYAWRRFRE